MFEKATKLKLRYKMPNGVLNTEDLWELKLEDLDKLAKSLNKELKESSEESFIKTRSNSDKITELKFEIVKHIISVKLAEKEAKVLAVERANKREQLRELIAQKKLTDMAGKSIAELEKELEETYL